MWLVGCRLCIAGLEVLGKEFCGFEGAENLVLNGDRRGQRDAVLSRMNRFDQQGDA